MRNVIVLFTALVLFAFCNTPETKDSKVAVEHKGSDPISADSAKMAFQDFEKYRDSVENILNQSRDTADAKMLALGFKLPKQEITAMAARIQATGYDSVYAMLAIRYDKRNQPYMTVVFQEYTGNTTPTPWTFYDFSRPCPPNCPTED